MGRLAQRARGREFDGLMLGAEESLLRCPVAQFMHLNLEDFTESQQVIPAEEPPAAPAPPQVMTWLRVFSSGSNACKG